MDMKMRALLVLATTFLMTELQAFGDEMIPQINLAHIAQIESSNRPWVINKKEQAYGSFQIRKAVLHDYNRAHKTKYTLQDMLKLHLATEVANWHLHVRIPKLLRSIKRPVTKEMILRVWNSGIGTVAEDRMPRITADYINKYHILEGR